MTTERVPLMQHRQRIRYADELRIEVEEVVEAAVCLRLVDVPGHDEITRVMIALALDEARVEIGERRVDVAHAFSKDLELLATAPFDERADDEGIDDLVFPSLANV